MSASTLTHVLQRRDGWQVGGEDSSIASMSSMPNFLVFRLARLNGSTRSNACCLRPRGKLSRMRDKTSANWRERERVSLLANGPVTSSPASSPIQRTLDFYMTEGSGRYASSGRISYAFGLRGASLTIDTACSSSLVAVHLAVQSIRNGESEAALAGAANIILQPQISIAYSQSRMMAEDGRCKFGDASGDGYVRSEGVAVVFLKALNRAVADGDKIYAVIRGSAINNDGHSSGSLGRPSRTGQEEVLRAAYRDAGLEAGLVEYIEAHGTGTRAGDPVELDALATVLGEALEPDRQIYVGSVKTNFGHTEAAAGMAGLIKAVLALRNAAIPPSLHFKIPNPAISWADLPFVIPREVTPWPASDGPRIAGVSGFGIAGTNAHVVLEEAPKQPSCRGGPTSF